MKWVKRRAIFEQVIINFVHYIWFCAVELLVGAQRFNQTNASDIVFSVGVDFDFNN